MNWYYESGGQQQGPVADSELDRLLADGKITLDTLVWRDGMPGWTPLRTARPSAPPVVPAPGDMDAGWEVTRPGTPVAPSAAGSDYPQPGWIQCSATGRYFPPSEIIYVEGKPYSAAAKPQIVASLQSGSSLPVGGMSGGGPAWEERETLGMWKALVATVKAVMSQPAQTFATMKRTGGIGSPLLFWFLTGGLGVAVGQLYGVLVQGAVSAAAASGANANQALPTFGITAAFGFVAIFAAPAAMLIGLFIQAGLSHLTLMMLKGANQPFEVTFRTMAYAFGATGTLHFIPLCGGTVAGIWGLVVACIGLGPAHGTTTGKGVAAMLIPFGICCVIMVGIYAAVIGSVVAAAAGAQ